MSKCNGLRFRRPVPHEFDCPFGQEEFCWRFPTQRYGTTPLFTSYTLGGLGGGAFQVLHLVAGFRRSASQDCDAGCWQGGGSSCNILWALTALPSIGYRSSLVQAPTRILPLIK